MLDRPAAGQRQAAACILCCHMLASLRHPGLACLELGLGLAQRQQLLLHLGGITRLVTCRLNRHLQQGRWHGSLGGVRRRLEQVSSGCSVRLCHATNDAAAVSPWGTFYAQSAPALERSTSPTHVLHIDSLYFHPCTCSSV